MSTFRTFVSNPIRESQNPVKPSAKDLNTCFKPYKGKSKYVILMNS